ncbi:DUF2334 domain-containing protein [Clostridium septicum]|uniref:DUF2334 domain-containing protein n=1 Tax=Clostridium septicum TaxID=1504 RepID=UPI000FF8E522|nr:DUF2334 domain-containing protein [Clostridium septicum]
MKMQEDVIGELSVSKKLFWDILNGEILNKFPNIKTTMFLVVGRREPIINKGHYFYSEAMNKSDEFIDFIKYLANKPNVELAYHGYSHGICSDDIYKFKEEWETFDNLEEAINSINKGKELFKEVTGKDFTGGKYCGYKYKEFSDKSIAYSDFLWWCRHWDGDLFFNNRDELSFELEEFDNVVDIPSTIDGSFIV